MGGLMAGVMAMALLGPVLVRAQTPFRVFVIAGTSADHSPMSTAGRPVLEKMGASNGFTIDFTTDKGLVNDANLAKYQVFMQLNLYPFDLGGPQRAALEKFVRQGKGWLGIHAAGCAQPDWAWFSELLGDITWVSHANFRNGAVAVEDREHPISRNLPASFRINDEWYVFSKSPRPKVKVLAKADGTGNASYDNGDHPMLWTSPLYQRAAYCSIGHDPADWSHSDYLALIRDALLWAHPVATRTDPMAGSKGYLLSPAAGRAWIQAGVLQVEMDAYGRVFGTVHPTDAVGRRLSIRAAGIAFPASGFRIRP